MLHVSSGTVLIMNLSFQVRLREGRVDRKTGSATVAQEAEQCLTRPVIQ